VVASSKQAKCPHGINAAFTGLSKHTGHVGIITSLVVVTTGGGNDGGGNDGGNDDISMVYEFTVEYKGVKLN
jgi:hypothetical protein